MYCYSHVKNNSINQAANNDMYIRRRTSLIFSTLSIIFIPKIQCQYPIILCWCLWKPYWKEILVESVTFISYMILQQHWKEALLHQSSIHRSFWEQLSPTPLICRMRLIQFLSKSHSFRAPSKSISPSPHHYRQVEGTKQHCGAPRGIQCNNTQEGLTGSSSRGGKGFKT